jgi:hypothetical protein
MGSKNPRGYATRGTTKRDAGKGRPWFVFVVVAHRTRVVWRAEPRGLRSSGKRGLTVQNEHVLVVREPRGKSVILVLKPG